MQHQNPQAFTLIELSIVLVIIGLIIGGVLVGKDLIKAAEIRKTISEKDEFDAAANTFKSKYNCLAGDCINATQFGFAAGIVGYSANGNGDGNVCIGDYSGECINFWHQLYYAGFIKQRWPNLDNVDVTPCFFPGFQSPKPPIAKQYNAGNLNCGSTTSPMRGGWAVLDMPALPDIALGRPGYQFNPLPYMGRVYMILTNEDFNGSRPNVISENEMRMIDHKIDDGLPLTGKVFAVSQNMYSPNFFYQLLLYPIPLINTPIVILPLVRN